MLQVQLNANNARSEINCNTMLRQYKFLRKIPLNEKKKESDSHSQSSSTTSEPGQRLWITK